MKTTIEVHGFEIKIDEMNDRIMVSAVKDGETVEEFELEVEEGFDDDKSMGFGEEEDDEDFGDDEMDDMGEDDDDDFEDDEMDDMGEEDEEGKTLESFANFVRRKKK